jgi:hypothetical protein
MKNITLLLLLCCSSASVTAQTSKTELYDFVKKFLYDSTGYENVGDWDIGNAKNFPVKWKEDRVMMSDDTSINFYRSGTVDLTINGRSYLQGGQPVKWSFMLKGPRMGYTNFSLISSPCNDIPTKSTIDSLFGKKLFKARLIKSCDTKPLTGFYYYEIKLPKKDVAFLKISWIAINEKKAIRIDCYDNWSKQSAKLDCPK